MTINKTIACCSKIVYTPMLTFLMVLAFSFACAQTNQSSFQLQQVRLLPGVFQEAQTTDLNYILALDPDRLLAPFLRESGLVPKKPSYESWENTGLDGHIEGHYLSALSDMYASTGDERLNQRLDYMLGVLKTCQDKNGNGYLGGTPGGLGMWKEIEAGKIVPDTFSLNGKWVPLYTTHKLLAGLRDAYVIAGKELAKTMLIRMTDFIFNISEKLTDDQIQSMLTSEHGSINEIFADVSVFTGDKKYLILARRYSHHFLLDPLVRGEDRLDGLHANMQIPKVVGFKRISEIDGDSNYLKAAEFFWETVVKHRTVVIGGNSEGEHFNSRKDFSIMMASIVGPETCNTYNMLRLTKALFKTSGNLSYMDYYERALFNHILSSQYPGIGGFVYYTPMHPRHYRQYSKLEECMWCCVGTGLENHGKYGELIYSYKGDDLFVNLFIPSRLTWSSKGIVISQHTAFPDEEKTELQIESANNTNPVGINIRYPIWVDEGKMQVSVNGKKIPFKSGPDQYISLKRKWKEKDHIVVTLPMKISVEQLPDGSNFFAFLHGPIVLAAKTDTVKFENQFSGNDQYKGDWSNGRIYNLDSVPYLSGNKKDLAGYFKSVPGKSQTFVAPELIGPAEFKDLEFIPFYKLHDARYMLYWQTKF